MMRELEDVENVAGAAKELAASEYAHTDPLTTPVEECFDWERELPDLVATSPGAHEFYIVVFRSIRKASADSLQLYAADAAAHDEARRSGGLLKVTQAHTPIPPVQSRTLHFDRNTRPVTWLQRSKTSTRSDKFITLSVPHFSYHFR